jgi:hypothetical protein
MDGAMLPGHLRMQSPQSEHGHAMNCSIRVHPNTASTHSMSARRMAGAFVVLGLPRRGKAPHA